MENKSRKFRIYVQIEGQFPHWEEFDMNKYIDNFENVTEEQLLKDVTTWANETIATFNNTLRPAETPRTLLWVDISDKPTPYQYRQEIESRLDEILACELEVEIGIMASDLKNYVTAHFFQ